MRALRKSELVRQIADDELVMSLLYMEISGLLACKLLKAGPRRRSAGGLPRQDSELPQHLGN